MNVSRAVTLRDRDGETTAPAARPTAEALLQVIGAMLVELRPGSPPRAPRLDSSLERELGLDSLARVELVLRLEREFGVSLPEQALASSETPRDLLRFLLAGAAPRAAAPDPPCDEPDREAAGRSPTEAQTLIEALEYHVERQPDRLHVMFLYEERRARSHYAALPAERGALMPPASRRRPRTPAKTVAIMLPTSKISSRFLRHAARGRHPGAALSAGAAHHHRGPPDAPRGILKNCAGGADGHDPGGEARSRGCCARR